MTNTEAYDWILQAPVGKMVTIPKGIMRDGAKAGYVLRVKWEHCAGRPPYVEAEFFLPDWGAIELVIWEKVESE